MTTPHKTLGEACVGRDNNLDIVRFVAASLVLVSHSFPLTGRGSEEPLTRLTHFSTMGTVSVNVFFVLSGFLITQSFVRQASAWRFIEARVLRILPGLALVTVFGVVLGATVTTLPLADYAAHAKTRAYLWTALLDVRYRLPGVFAANPYPSVMNGSLWSLPAEVYMYVLTLVLGALALLRERAAGTVALGVVALWILVSPQTFPLLISPSLEFTTPALSYLMGSAFFLLRDRVPLSWRYILAFVAVAYFFRAHALSRTFVWLAIAYGALWLSLARPTFPRFARYGDFSYGMYLYAFPIQQWVVAQGYGTTPISMTLLAFPLTFLAAAASWHLVEKRAMGWKGRFVPAPKGATSGA
jgi:peptidoglycan/LPS O-acetylase OafA/YrhL